MIISHKYRFIYIKTYKTAGTSLEVYASRYCGDDDVVTEIFPAIAGHRARNPGSFYNHIAASEVKRRVGEDIWNSYLKFCVERNPWDKVLSFYWMERFRSGGHLDIDEFLSRDHIGINWSLYSDENGGYPIVDKVLRYEALDAELTELFNNLGIPWPGRLEPREKSEYRQDRRNYKDVFTRSQADYIAKRFEKEIEWHGYKY